MRVAYTQWRINTFDAAWNCLDPWVGEGEESGVLAGGPWLRGVPLRLVNAGPWVRDRCLPAMNLVVGADEVPDDHAIVDGEDRS